MEQQYNLPKNIRQIGQADKKPGIYIEDYIITFARKLAESNENRMGMAVLLGKPSQKDEKTPVFIKGAVKVTRTEENGSLVFDNQTWSAIYEGVKNYFSELEIVGWMLLRFGHDSELDEKIKEIHKVNFGENGNLLFIFDREEKEENFYRFENGQFEKQPGYYIYYEKNEPMQDYMINLFGNKSQEPAGEDKVMEQVRQLISNKETYQNKRTANFVYAASTALAAVVLVMGITTLNNYDKMESMEATLNHISANMGEKEENELVVETITGTVQKESEQIEANSNSEPEQQDEEDKTEEIEENGVEESQTKNENTILDEKEKDETTETMAEEKYYIVKKGDTLVTISGALYGSDEYVEEIQQLNQIENRDMIYEGQKLLIP